MVYGQSEVMRDLNEAADARELTVVYEAEDVVENGLSRPKILFGST